VIGRQAFHLLAAGLLALVAMGPISCGGAGTSSSPMTGQSRPTTAADNGGGPSPQARRVVVPKVVGDHYRLAVRELHERGLTAHAPGFTGSYSSTGMNGCETILNQAPAPGSKVHPHSVVAIVIGLAPC
jgi:hypothetical protein